MNASSSCADPCQTCSGQLNAPIRVRPVRVERRRKVTIISIPYAVFPIISADVHMYDYDCSGGEETSQGERGARHTTAPFYLLWTSARLITTATFYGLSTVTYRETLLVFLLFFFSNGD